MLQMLAIATIAASSAVTLPAAQQRECRHEAIRSVTLAATAQDRLDLIARAGSLRVIGRAGLSEVRVRGRACASSEDLLEQLQIETERSGNAVRVEAAEVESSGFSLGNRYHYLDLEIEVPAGMAADIQDGSGEIWLEDLGSVDLTDGSGELQVRDLTGDLSINDGSGQVEVHGVAGDVNVEDGSGEILVEGVGGSVTVHDGSGQIEITDVEGSVRVTDGSGEINVNDVRGDFIVDQDGSGAVVYNDVAGRVDIPARKRRGP